MKFYDICILFDFISAAAIYFVFFFPKWIKNKKELFTKSCLFIYVTGVLYFTCIIPVLIPIPFVNFNPAGIHINLIPYIDYVYSRGDFIRQILLNILMTVPFGIMIPFIYHKNFSCTILSGFSFSAAIELIQMVSVRQISSCDITDVINNTVGVLIGYILYRIFNRPAKAVLNKLFSNKERKSFSCKKKIKISVIAVILIQLIIRSVIRMFI